MTKMICSLIKLLLAIVLLLPIGGRSYAGETPILLSPWVFPLAAAQALLVGPTLIVEAIGESRSDSSEREQIIAIYNVIKPTLDFFSVDPITHDEAAGCMNFVSNTMASFSETNVNIYRCIIRNLSTGGILKKSVEAYINRFYNQQVPNFRFTTYKNRLELNGEEQVRLNKILAATGTR